jgi:hypothetical protein
MAGDLTPIPPFTTFGEKIANDRGVIGIRTWVRTIERAACMAVWKKLNGILTGYPQRYAMISQRDASDASRPARSGCMSADTQRRQDGLWPRPIGPQSLAEVRRLSDVATIEHSV